MVAMTKAGSLMGARETTCTPSAKSCARSGATSSARRVLPTPAVPVRVSRRTSGRTSKAWIACTSCSRPISDVSETGRVCVTSRAVSPARGSGKTMMLSCIACLSSAEMHDEGYQEPEQKEVFSYELCYFLQSILAAVYHSHREKCTNDAANDALVCRRSRGYTATYQSPKQRIL